LESLWEKKWVRPNEGKEVVNWKSERRRPKVRKERTPCSQEELMVRLDKKLVVLRAEQEAVREEGEVNEALGSRVGTRVADVASSAEASKYRLHVEEVGKITSLLLGLSGRLARVENALYGMAADHAERVSTIPAWLSNLLIHLPIPYNFGRFAILAPDFSLPPGTRKRSAKLQSSKVPLYLLKGHSEACHTCPMLFPYFPLKFSSKLLTGIAQDASSKPCPFVIKSPRLLSSSRDILASVPRVSNAYGVK
jgi:hypothetical protein